MRHALRGAVSTSYFGQLADPLVEVMLPLTLLVMPAIVWLAAKMLYSRAAAPR